MSEETPVTQINPTPIRSFIRRHKTGLAVAATAVTGIVVTQFAVRQHDEFLKEQGLYDEFYGIETQDE